MTSRTRAPASLAALLIALAACSSGGGDARPAAAGAGGATASTSTTGTGGSTGATSTTGTGGSAGATASTGGGGAGGGAGGGGAPATPDKPAGLVTYLVGDDADADVTPTGPGLVLMGGGADVDEAFLWWKGLIAGGDVVVLRASGGGGYGDYLYADIGGCDSVETLMVTTRALAESDYVAWRVRHAEGVFLAGGDQAVYLEEWKDTALAAALADAYARGAVVGGTSAGCAVLGGHAFAAYNDTVYSDEALADPYDPHVTLDRGLVALPVMAGVVTDPHFAERDRMGRLLAFVARLEQDGASDPTLGVGIDEATAIVVGPDGAGTVVGAGSVYLVHSAGVPAVCEPGVPLEYAATYQTLSAGDTLTLPSGASAAPSAPIVASGGAITPADPY